MESDAEAEVFRLDNAWNGAYRRHDRAPLESILADDFTALTPSGEPITKASLMVNPSEIARSVTFSEQAVHVFGKTAKTRGRLQLDLTTVALTSGSSASSPIEMGLGGRLASRL